MAFRKNFTIEQKDYVIAKLRANQNNISKASKDLGFIFYIVYKSMDSCDFSEKKSYLTYMSMNLSDVQTAPTSTLLLVHGLIFMILR